MVLLNEGEVSPKVRLRGRYPIWPKTHVRDSFYINGLKEKNAIYPTYFIYPANGDKTSC